MASTPQVVAAARQLLLVARLQPAPHQGRQLQPAQETVEAVLLPPRRRLGHLSRLGQRGVVQQDMGRSLAALVVGLRIPHLAQPHMPGGHPNSAALGVEVGVTHPMRRPVPVVRVAQPRRGVLS